MDHTHAITITKIITVTRLMKVWCAIRFVA